jgi:hypothetical protein
MIKTLIARYRQNSFIESHRFLLLYANIIAVIHGIGFILQGTMRSDNLIKYALTDVNAWHGGLPALSIFNVSLLSGAFTIIFAFITVYLIIQKLHSKWHWLLTITLFFSGGGFVYFFIASITHVSLYLKEIKQHSKYSVLGEALLILLFLWMVGSWILGWIFPVLMLNIGLALFFIFDLIMPLIILFVHRYNRLPV